MRWSTPGTVLLLAALISGGCSDPTVVESADAGETGDPGEQPEGAGEMYSACISSDQCEPLEFCVFPSGEDGFCSAACAAGSDNSSCDVLPNGAEDATCLGIGLPDDRRVCAIDCEEGRSCPDGMRCERVDSAGVDRSICF